MNKPQPIPLLLTVDDVCDALNLGKTKVRELIRDGELRACFIGKALRVHRDEVDRFVNDLPVRCESKTQEFK